MQKCRLFFAPDSSDSFCVAVACEHFFVAAFVQQKTPEKYGEQTVKTKL